MSDTLEERLAALEQTVVNMQKTIDDLRLDTETDRLRTSIDNLTAQLSTSNRQRPQGRYEPWGDEHEALHTHRYVAREVLSNVLWRAMRSAGNIYTGFGAVNDLLDSMPAHAITPHSRFPSHGLYINVNNLDVYVLIQQLKEYAFTASYKGNLPGYTERLEEVVAKLQTLAVASVGSGRTVGMIHDRNSFEEEYKLTWISGHDAEEVGTVEHEVPVTGLTTSV